jgi:hypothetical protein
MLSKPLYADILMIRGAICFFRGEAIRRGHVDMTFKQRCNVFSRAMQYLLTARSLVDYNCVQALLTRASVNFNIGNVLESMPFANPRLTPEPFFVE